MLLKTSTSFLCPWYMSQSANLLLFPIKSSIFVILGWETMCMSKARGWPRNRRMPDPWAMQNLLMPQPRDCQGRQMPHSGPGGTGNGRSWNWLMHWARVSSSKQYYNIPANSHALGVSLTPAGWKLRSHARSRLRTNFSRLIEKCESLPSCLTQFPKIC